MAILPAGTTRLAALEGQTELKRAVVVGGGLAGLAAARDLVLAGWQVTLLEAGTAWGGLASALTIAGERVERFYHFVCRSDDALVGLARELGIEQRLHWTRTRTAFFYHGRHYRFGTPLDLLRFTPVPFAQRVRFGLHVLSSRLRSQWKALDDVPAQQWLVQHIGQQAYDVIWHPLLWGKFGQDEQEIAAAWMWHRIWRVARSRQHLLAPEMFGFFEEGSFTIVQALVDWLTARPQQVQLRLHTPVRTLQRDENSWQVQLMNDETLTADAVISTVALPVLMRLLPQASASYRQQLSSIPMIGVVCLLLRLRQSFSPNFWLNIHDPQVAFNGVIELTNLNLRLRQAGLNLLYVPFYLPTDSERYQRADEGLMSEYLSALRRVNPAFDESWVEEAYISREAYAQAVCKVGFLQRMPDVRAPLPGLYVSDSTQFYPEDRTLSAAIRRGRLAAACAREDVR